MKKIFFFLSSAVFILSACSDSSVDEHYQPANYTVKGKVEKGPFISGTTINMQPMNAKLTPNGSSYSATISDHSGNFSFNSAKFEEPFAQLSANGYFFNEVTGQLSRGTLALRALANLAEKSTVNVNILTHLKYSRIQKLVDDGKSYTEANKQAQKELLTAFGLQKYADTDATNYTISAGTPEAGALIAISSMILKGRSEAQVTEYLAQLSSEFGENGTFSEATKETLKKDRNSLFSMLRTIENNIKERYKELGQTVTVKPLEYYFDWDDDGIAGNEIADKNNPPKLSVSDINVPKEGGEYTVTIDSDIKLYLNPNKLRENNDGIKTVTVNNPPISLYDIDYTPGEINRRLDGNTLKIFVFKTNSKQATTSNVSLYDIVGNVVATVAIHQEGDASLRDPGLGEGAKSIIESEIERVSYTMDLISTDVDNYNSTSRSFVAPIETYNSTVERMWNNFYYSISAINRMKQEDEQVHSLFGTQFTMFNSILYYHMVTLWGGVPYLTTQPDINTISISRNSESEILSDLQSKIEAAIPKLEEKKNSSQSVNDMFFVSKDVARILLADILMYQNKYDKAKPYLKKVIENGYYTLNSQDGGVIMRYKTATLYSLADVMLSLAECEYKQGNTSSAWQYAKQVANTMGTFRSQTAPSGILEYIYQVRKVSLSSTVGRFAFLKRTGIAKSKLGLKDYQLLLPIPAKELANNSGMKQNPGY